MTFLSVLKCTRQEEWRPTSPHQTLPCLKQIKVQVTHEKPPDDMGRRPLTRQG